MEEDNYKQMARNNYKGADIYMLWNNYFRRKKQLNETKRNGWKDDARNAELEMKVMVELMREIHPSIKQRFNQELEVEYHHSGKCSHNLDKALHAIEDLEFFRTEILNRHEN